MNLIGTTLSIARITDYDTKMDIRQGSFINRIALFVARTISRGRTCEDKDARRTCVFRSKTCREGWEVVCMPQVPNDDGEA